MMTLSLPETDIPNKTLDDPTTGSGAIVIRFPLNGTYSAQIFAEESDEQDTLRERFTAARPLLEMMQGIFTVKPLRDQTEGFRS